MLKNGRFIEPLTLGDINFLELVYEARDGLLQIQKRWENRIVFENISVAEEYSKGRLSIVCYVELGGSGDRVQFSTIADYKSYSNPIVVVIMCAHTSQLCDRNNRDQQSMLANDVQLVKTPQGIVPSFVWLNYIDEQGADFLSGHLYFSTVDGFYQFVSCVTDREMGIPGWDMPGQGNNFADHNVQAGAQIMNNVTNNQRDFPWNRIGIECQDIVPIDVVVDMQTVKVSFKEGRKTSLKLLDVLVGPFDL